MSSLNSYKYIFEFLDANRLNELLYRFTYGNIANDIQELINADSDLSDQNIQVFSNIINNKNDIYGIIKVTKDNIPLFHFTIHFLPHLVQTNYIGPLHYKNNIKLNRGTRINIVPIYNSNKNLVKLNFINASNRNRSYKQTNKFIYKIVNYIKDVLGAYFDDTDNSSTSMSLTNPYYESSYTTPQKNFNNIIKFLRRDRPNILIKPTILFKRNGGTYLRSKTNSNRKTRKNNKL